MPQEPDIFQQFARSIGGKDPKTIAVYLSVLRDLANWLAERPGGTPFRVELLTATALRGYMDHLAQEERAPRTRRKALTAIRRFCRWVVDEGLLRRNPANQIEAPDVVAMSPRELDDDQRYILKNLVEAQESPKRWRPTRSATQHAWKRTPSPSPKRLGDRCLSAPNTQRHFLLSTRRAAGDDLITLVPRVLG